MSSSSKKKYFLEMLIEKNKAKSKILADVKELIKVNGLSVTIKQTKAKHLFLSIEGTLEAIDEGHAVLTKFCQKKKLPFFRITDQAGDKVRRDAYRVLADMEQLLRTFIIRTTTETLGFDWWLTYVSEDVRSKIEGIMPKRDKLSPAPIEYTTFEQLINLTTAEVYQWGSDKVLTPNDLRELLADSNSLEEVLDKLDSKTKALSLWEDVFSLYFSDKQQWSDAKEILKFAINQRNAVMHHRPIRLGTLKALQDKKRKLKSLFKKAKDELEPQEIKLALETLRAFSVVARVIQEAGQARNIAMAQLLGQMPAIREAQMAQRQAIRNILSQSPLREQMAQMQAVTKILSHYPFYSGEREEEE